MNQQPIEKRVLQIVSAVGFFICVAVAVWGWQTGVLTSQERLQKLVGSLGLAGGVLFTVFQAVQVVIPILPGGLGCLVGVILFGPLWGFAYNYTGICIGSLLAFAVARTCGKPLLHLLFPRNHREVPPLDRGTGPLCKTVRAGNLLSRGPRRLPLLPGRNHRNVLAEIYCHHPPGKALRHRALQPGPDRRLEPDRSLIPSPLISTDFCRISAYPILSEGPVQTPPWAISSGSSAAPVPISIEGNRRRLVLRRF